MPDLALLDQLLTVTLPALSAGVSSSAIITILTEAHACFSGKTDVTAAQLQAFAAEQAARHAESDAHQQAIQTMLAEIRKRQLLGTDAIMRGLDDLKSATGRLEAAIDKAVKKAIQQAEETGEWKGRYAELEKQHEAIKTAYFDLAKEAVKRGGADRKKLCQAIDDTAKSGDTKSAEDQYEHLIAEMDADISERRKDASRYAVNLGVLRYNHDTHGAKAAFEKAVELDPENTNAWNRLGHVLKRLGKLPEAEAAYKRVLKAGKLSGNMQWVAATYGNLGLIARRRGELDNAEAYFNDSLEISEKEGFKGLSANQYGNLGLIAMTRGDLDQAEEYHLKSLEIEKELGRKEGMASEYGNLGLIAMNRGDLDQAEGNYKDSLEISEKEGFKELSANQYGNLGAIYELRADLSTACKHWKQARDLFAQIGMPHMVEQLSDWLREAGCPDA